MVEGFEAFAGLVSNRRKTRTALLRTYGGRRGVAVKTLERWVRKYRAEGADGLLDRRGGRGPGDDGISPAAFLLFKRVYLSPAQPSIKLVWAFVQFVNQQNRCGWKVPAHRTMCLYVNERIPEPVRILAREGIKACEARFGAYVTALVAKDCESLYPSPKSRQKSDGF